MRTLALIACLFICAHAFAQQAISPATAFKRYPVSKAEVDALKHPQRNHRMAPSIVLDYDLVDENATGNAGGVYERFVWDMNTHYPNTPDYFALTWGVVKFDTLYDANTGIAYPRNTTSVKVDSLQVLITHQNITPTPDTILISMYAYTGSVGLQIDAQDNITNAVLWDTMVISNNSLSPGALMLRTLSVFPNITLTYPNNRYLVGVHFYGDTTNTFTILAGYGNRCNESCFAWPSVFQLNSFWRMIAWANPTTELTGVNNIAYDCNSNSVAGESAFCEEFPIQNFAISSFVTLNTPLVANANNVTKCPGQSAQLSVTASGGTPPYTYSWSPTTGLSGANTATPTTTVNATTNYTVTVGDNVGGSTTKAVTVTVNGITINAGNDRSIGCGQTVTITPTVGGVTTGAQYIWSNGTTSLSNNNLGAGTYTVSVTNSSGCTASDVVVVSNPNISQTLNFTTGLPNNSGCRNVAIQFTNTSTRQNGWNWTWNFGNGNTSSSASPSYTYATNGVYTVTLQADSAGCTAPSVSKTITITACGSSGCTPNSATGTPGLSPQWQCLPCVQRSVAYAEVIQVENFSNVGGLTIVSLRIDSITDLPTGLTYTLNPANGVLPGGTTGCIDITGTTSVSTGNYQIGLYVTVNIMGLGSISGEASDLIQDMIDIGIIDTTITPAPDFSYFIRVIQQGGNCVMTSCGACNAPAASFTQTANNTAVSFTDNSTNAPTSWSWNFGDGSTSTQQNPSHTYAGAGSYNVCLTATNSCGNNTSCQNVTVTCPGPSAGFSSSASHTAVTFTNSSTNATSYSWTFGDGGTSTLQNPSHTYAGAGTYNVCLTATNSCGNNQICQNVTVTCPGPSAGFSSGASGTAVTFTNSSTNATSYAWTFGDGGTSTLQNPSHTYAGSGTYNVCLTATNACGNNQSCQNITVTCAAPSASFTNNAQGTSVSFTDNSTNGPTSWSWNFGNGQTSTQQNPSILYANSGTYNVCLTVTNSCGNNQICQNITVTCIAPAAGFTYSGASTTITFADNTINGVTSWAWVFGDGSTSTQQNPSHTYASAGNYQVCLTATNGCGNNQSCQTITVTCPTPSPSFTYSGASTTIAFTGNSTNSPTSWAWIFGDGSTSSQQSPSHTYSTGGNYNVCLTTTNSCGNNQSCQTITVTCPTPSPSFTYSGASTTIAFTGNSTNSPTSWAWTFGDGSTSSQQSPSHTYSTGGNFSVCLTTTNSCGSNQSCQTVTVTCPAPSPGFTYSGSGTTISFSENSTNSPTSWSWTFGDGSTSTQRNPSHTYTTAGNYQVCLTATNNCGNNVNCQTITVTCPTPEADFVYNDSGTSVSFTDNSSNSPTAWSWTFGDGQSSTQQNPSHNYATSGNYSVCITATNSCGNDTYCETIAVTCNVGPSAAFAHTANGTTVSFTDNSTNGATAWSWSFGDGQTSNQENPSHTYANPGSYTVCLNASNLCGSDQSCETIVVTPVGIAALEKSPLRIYPNPFTEITTIEIPDEVKGTYDLRVLDLLGNEVKLLDNISDRKFFLQSEDLAKGVYFIEVRAEKRYFGKVVLN